jgi:hypothetical protein
MVKFSSTVQGAVPDRACGLILTLLDVTGKEACNEIKELVDALTVYSGPAVAAHG